MWGLLGSALYALAFGALLHGIYDGIRILRALCGVRYGGRISGRLRACAFPLLPPDFATRAPARIGRRLRAAVIVVTDVLFCLMAAFLFAIFVYWQNDGVFRMLLLLCAGGGFFLWHITLGRLIVTWAETLAILLRVALAYLLLAISVPLRLLLRLLSRLGRLLVRVLRRAFCFFYRHIRLPLYSRREEKRRLRTAFGGMLPVKRDGGP